VTEAPTLPTDTIHGLSWRAAFALRDRHAHHWHRRLRGLVPVADLQSAGNEAMTRAVQAYDPTRGVPFVVLLNRCLVQAMLNMRRDSSTPKAAPSGPHRLTLAQQVSCSPHWAGWETVLHPVFPQGEARVLAQEIVADLYAQYGQDVVLAYVWKAMDTPVPPHTTSMQALYAYGWTPADVRFHTAVQARIPHWTGQSQGSQ
jgi:hypothetical protein